MAYEFNVPFIDFVNDFDEHDGADKFFDVHCQLGKLSITEDKEVEEGENKNISAKTEVKCEDDLPEERRNEESIVDEPELSDSGIEGDDAKAPVSGDASTLAVLSEISDATQNIKNNHTSKKRKSTEPHSCSKFISLAESVRKFQVATPPRFHSQPKRLPGRAQYQRRPKEFQPLLLTIPQSPCLASKNRSRPIDYPSAEEREQRELEEIQAFKLEVHPVNTKVFEQPKCGKRVAKQPTLVEPFKLTEFKRKVVRENSSPFRFKAQAIPKGILERPTGLPEKKTLPLTTPSTPQVLAKHKPKFISHDVKDGKLCLTFKDAGHTSVQRAATPPAKTQPQPFSFEERDRQMRQHKEDMIKKVLQEEKEARNFQANPLPGYLKKRAKNLDVTNSSVKSNESEEGKAAVSFRAAPAAVLNRAPFVPRLPERSQLELRPPPLATEERARQRAEFDAAVKEQLRNIEETLKQRQEAEEERLRQEEASLRQKMVHRAQPIRSYKAVPEAVRLPVTSPKSPRFVQRPGRLQQPH